jgi:NAD(P)-dependent dehydrogenase (short-subunit alcohol dehydrogenase family)
MGEGSIVIVGGTHGLGLEIARYHVKLGRSVVVTGRDRERSASVAAELGSDVLGLGFDLTEPETIREGLAEVGPVDHLVLAAIERDQNPLDAYDVSAARRLATLKLVGYTEAIHVLSDRIGRDGSIVIFGGRAKDRPYPGSTTVTAVNGAVSGMVRTISLQMAPVRCNGIHPGIVGDSPYWSGKTDYLEDVRGRTPTKRLVTMEDIVGATAFLLENRSVNGIDLYVDGGWLLM